MCLSWIWDANYWRLVLQYFCYMIYNNIFGRNFHIHLHSSQQPSLSTLCLFSNFFSSLAAAEPASSGLALQQSHWPRTGECSCVCESTMGLPRGIDNQPCNPQQGLFSKREWIGKTHFKFVHYLIFS